VGGITWLGMVTDGEDGGSLYIGGGVGGTADVHDVGSNWGGLDDVGVFLGPRTRLWGALGCSTG
jgi:hypothetical protein